MNMLKRKDSKVLLLEFLGNIASVESCGKKVKVKLRGVNLSNLDLYGINIDNIYCDDCNLSGLKYAWFSDENNICKKSGSQLFSKDHSDGKNVLAVECNWNYVSHATVDYNRLKNDE